MYSTCMCVHDLNFYDVDIYQLYSYRGGKPFVERKNKEKDCVITIVFISPDE